MQQTREIVGWVATVISCFGFIPYVVEYIRGKTSPHQSSWIIWAGLQYIIFKSSRDQGASASTWINLGYLIGSSTNAVLLFWYGSRRWGRLDYICGGLGLISLGLLYSNQSNISLALFLAILTDGIASTPTVVGVTKQPETESRLGWSVFMVGATLNLFSIKRWNFPEAGFTIYVVIVIGYIVANVWRHKSR